MILIKSRLLHLSRQGAAMANLADLAAPCHKGTVIGVSRGTRVSFDHVLVSADMVFGLRLDHCYASFKNCTILNGLTPLVLNESEVLMDDSLVYVSMRASPAVVMFSMSKFTATKSRFNSSGSAVGVYDRSHCVIDHCRFERDHTSDAEFPDVAFTEKGWFFHYSRDPNCVAEYPAIATVEGGCVTIEGSLFRGSYVCAVAVEGLHSKADLKTSEVANLPCVAQVERCARLAVENCNIDCSSQLVKIVFHPEGMIKLVKNRLSASTPRIIAIDSTSEKPEHDVEDLVFEQTKNKQLICLNLLFNGNIKFKRCMRCGRRENFRTKIKESYGKSATLPFHLHGMESLMV